MLDKTTLIRPMISADYNSAVTSCTARRIRNDGTPLQRMPPSASLIRNRATEKTEVGK